MSSGWRIFSPLAEVESPPIAPSSSLKIFPNRTKNRVAFFMEGGVDTRTRQQRRFSLPPPLRIDYVNPCLKAGPVTTQRVEMGVAQLCQKLKEKSRDNKTTQKILYYNPPLLTKSIAHYTTSTHTHTPICFSPVCVCVCEGVGGQQPKTSSRSQRPTLDSFLWLLTLALCIYSNNKI
jgi:hypothetical protein